MKKGLKVIAIVMAVVLVFGVFTACAAAPAAAPSADANAAAPAAAQGGSTLGMRGDPSEEYYALCFVSGVEYWFPVYAAFKQAGNNLGVKTFYVGTTEYDATKEIEVFEQTLAKKPKGIFLSPITAEAFKEPIDRAVEQGVAIVTWASDSPESNRQGFVTSDNVNEGRSAARAIAEEMGGKGKVMVLRNPGQTNHDIRCDSFIATIETEYPDMEVVADEVSNQDPNASYTAVMTVAQKHPDLGAVFAPEANSGLGASNAAKELGGNIKCLCVDVNAQILDMIKTGDFWMALNPDQGMQGYFAMLLLFTLAHPELIDPMNGKKEQGLNPTYIPLIDNGLNLITKENADYFYVDKYAESLGYASVEDMLGPGDPSKGK